MYKTSDEYKNKILEHSRQFETKITIGNRVITNEEVTSLSVQQQIQQDATFSVGNAIASVLNLNFLHNDIDSNDRDSINVQLGLLVNGEYEYIPIGIYNIETLNSNDTITTIVAYDNMVKFDKLYSENIERPTVHSIINRLVEITGVKFDGNLYDYNNYSLIALKGYSCREILGYIAGVLGCNATIGRDGKFKFINVSTNSNLEVTSDNYINYSRQSKLYKISKLINATDNATLELGIISNDTVCLNMSNPYVNDEILRDLYNKFNGFSFLPYELSWQGDPSIDLGDFISIIDTKGIKRTQPVLSQNFSYSGALNSTVQAQGDTKLANSYTTKTSEEAEIDRVKNENSEISEKVDNAQSSADKANQTANNANSQVALLEKSLTGITQKVQEVETTTTTLSGKVDSVQSTANANKSNLSNLTTRVSTAESKLTKDSLTTTIGSHYTTSNDVNGLVTSKGYQTQSQVQQAVDKLQMKFISSGGYNLLSNTGFNNGLNSWYSYRASLSVVDETSSASGKAIKSVATGGGQGFYQPYKSQEEGYYTLTFYAKADRSMNIYCGQENTSTPTFAINTNWQKFTHTFYRNSTSSDSYIFYASQSGTFYIHSILVEKGELSSLWSPHPNELYDGITQIDREGIKVMQSGINGHTHMNASGFYVNKDGEDVVKVTNDGVYIKGKVDIVSGNIPTNLLNGTINSNQLNSSITNDINTAKNNASSALGTANTANNTANSASSKADKAQDAADKAQTSANSAQSTANDASGKADAAKDTANKAQATANAVNGTVNSNKDNWSNAYNRVQEWANGAVTGRTEINGGMIATNTITANKIAVGDFNNYSQLRKGFSLNNGDGTANWSQSGGEWYSQNTYFPTTIDKTDNAFSTGDEINFKATVWIGGQKDVRFGVWFYDVNGNYVCEGTVTKTLYTGWNTVNATVKLTDTNINKCPYMNVMIHNSGTYIAVKDVVVNRKITGELIVDGAINGKRIEGVDVVGSTFSSTSGDFKVLDDGTVDATSLSVEDEISTDTLNVEYISNTKYQAVIDRNYEVHINPWYDWESEGLQHGGHYKSLSSFIDACPRNLNGYNITVSIWSDLTESVNFNMFNNGVLTINLNGCTIYGYIVCNNHSMRYRIYGNNPSSTGTTTVGSIMPNTGYSATGGYYSLMSSYTHLTVYDMKLYGGKANGNNNGLCVTNLSKCYANNVQFIGCYSGVRAYSVSNVYVSSSSGLTSNVAFYAGSGSTISLNNTNQAGRSGSTSHTGSANNGQVLSTGVTFSSSAVSGSNTTTSTPVVTKTATITANYGDTYRKTVYNNWKKDGSVRQGEWGNYGDCVGAWFFGEKISSYSDKNITGVSITIKRQAGGSSSAVTHTLKMHDYETRPSGSPSFRSDFSKDFSVATNKSVTINLTSAEITAFKKCKGLGLVPKAYNSTYYSVCSGSISVKITYKE